MNLVQSCTHSRPQELLGSVQPSPGVANLAQDAQLTPAPETRAYNVTSGFSHAHVRRRRNFAGRPLGGVASGEWTGPERWAGWGLTTAVCAGEREPGV